VLSSVLVLDLLMSSNCSFRITRTTEDLAQTITALSQRLIKLEQRFAAIELQINQAQVDMPVQEIEMLDGIDQQLKECKELLQTSSGEKEKEVEEDNSEIESNLEESNPIELVEEELLEESNPIELVEEELLQENNTTWIEENKEETFAA
tara:strand:- start:1759 stop:2208 length:450 start_codon:yes stop_codon:yes gene_type:complete